MFHISFLVRDKHLAETLRALENRVMNLEVRPTKQKDEDKKFDFFPGGEQAKPSPRKRPDVFAIVQRWIDAGAPFTTAEIQAHDNISESAAHKALVLALDQGTVIRFKKGKGYLYVRRDTASPGTSATQTGTLEPVA